MGLYAGLGGIIFVESFGHVLKFLDEGQDCLHLCRLLVAKLHLLRTGTDLTSGLLVEEEIHKGDNNEGAKDDVS